MSNSTELKSERTRRRILDAAAGVFSEQGYSNARLADVAERAGMQTGSLYYHFEGREDLVDEILRLGIEMSWTHVRAAIEALPDDATPLTRLATAIRAQTNVVLETSVYASAQARISGQVPPAVRERHLVDQRNYGNYWHELIRAAIVSGELRADIDPFVARALALGAMNWTAEWYRPERGIPASVVAEQAVQMILYGLASTRKTERRALREAATAANGRSAQPAGDLTAPRQPARRSAAAAKRKPAARAVRADTRTTNVSPKSKAGRPPRPKSS